MGFDSMTSETVRVARGHPPGIGSGWACGLSTEKLWQRETSFDGEVGRDTVVDLQTFSTAVLFPRLQFRFDFVLPFCSLGLIKR
jgi:hypothetical protein